MSTYIGKIKIGTSGEEIPIGSTLYGKCETNASDYNKKVTLNGFDTLTAGVTIYVKFTAGNTAVNNASSSVTLQINQSTVPNAAIVPVIGNCTCNANEILGFTFEQNATDPIRCWRVHTCGGIVTRSELDTAIANLPKGMHFRGVLSALPNSETSFENYDNGDIIALTSGKEYIYVKGEEDTASTAHWSEIGDETAYALESNTDTVNTVTSWLGASISGGVLTLPVLTTGSKNVIVPRNTN